MRRSGQTGFRAALGLGLLTGVSAGAFVPRAGAQGAEAGRTPVLVELFTSEGCSSCPPADRLLGELDRRQPVPGAEIVVLGEHVDYWDEGGWHDRFSSSIFTTRQQRYAQRFGTAGPYTPQMVVDGRTEFVGSDERRAVAAIRAAAARPKLRLTIGSATAEGRRVSGEVAVPAGGAGTIFAALVEPSAVTEVQRGENGGRRLVHAGVVRSLIQIGTPTKNGGVTVPFTLSVPPNAGPGAMRVVVFTADGNGAVTGVAEREIAVGQASAAGQP